MALGEPRSSSRSTHLAQAAQGETQSLGSFAQYANLDIKDMLQGAITNE
jgi:hypothetical protein